MRVQGSGCLSSSDARCTPLLCRQRRRFVQRQDHNGRQKRDGAWQDRRPARARIQGRESHHRLVNPRLQSHRQVSGPQLTVPSLFSKSCLSHTIRPISTKNSRGLARTAITVGHETSSAVPCRTAGIVTLPPVRCVESLQDPRQRRRSQRGAVASSGEVQLHVLRLC